MKILVVEDSPLKASIILEYLAITSPDLPVSLERSYQKGLRAIVEQSPDLVILDMTLPNFDVAPGERSGKPRPLGGYDLLRKIRRRALPTKVLIVTQYESFGEGADMLSFTELRDRCRAEFPSIFLDAVFFAQASTAWKEAITTAIQGSKNK